MGPGHDPIKLCLISSLLRDGRARTIEESGAFAARYFQSSKSSVRLLRRR